MVLIYHDIYFIKCRIWFSCSNFDDHPKGQSFKTPLSGCVSTERRAVLKVTESLNPKEPAIKKTEISYVQLSIFRVKL